MFTKKITSVDGKYYYLKIDCMIAALSPNKRMPAKLGR
jgi:hypothetical protein